MTNDNRIKFGKGTPFTVEKKKPDGWAGVGTAGNPLYCFICAGLCDTVLGLHAKNFSGLGICRDCIKEGLDLINEVPPKEIDKGQISDGYHTFDQLYDHRCHLFIALMRSNPALSWRAKRHEDGSMYRSWFIAGMNLPTGQISYHLPLLMWDMLDNCKIETNELPPMPWDGHTSGDVIDRLAALFKGSVAVLG